MQSAALPPICRIEPKKGELSHDKPRHFIMSPPLPARRSAISISTRVMLGLRLVKKTVNFDDPGTYHFYFGDAAGSPGTILTFFPWPHAAPGRSGIGETFETEFRDSRSLDRLLDASLRHVWRCA